MKATAFLEARPAELEVILAAPDQSFRWYEHDYPYALGWPATMSGPLPQVMWP